MPYDLMKQTENWLQQGNPIVTNSNIYDPVQQQTMFLGCSISSFNCTLGWNSQISEVTVQLVPDSCPAPSGKVYYDASCAKHMWTLADPAYTSGFIGDAYEIVGCPVYFRVANFEFAGIIQSWEENKSESAFPVYTVKISDPRQVLEGTQLIIGDYAGGVSTSFNILNIYGCWEQFGLPNPELYYQSFDNTGKHLSAYAENYLFPNSLLCQTINPNMWPDGPIFGSPSLAFGGSNTNTNGMQWNKIVQGLQILTSSIPKYTSPFSPYGRLIYRGVSDSAIIGFSGSWSCGIIGSDNFIPPNLYCSEYFLDITSLPQMPEYWRLNGSTISLLDAINQVCEAASYDYYVELIPIKVGNKIIKIIDVRTCSKLTIPSLTAINQFISSNSTQATSTNRGRELRNEATSTFIIGGKRNGVYQIETALAPAWSNTKYYSSGMTVSYNGSIYTALRQNHNSAPNSNIKDWNIGDFILPFFGYDYNGNGIIPTKDKYDNWCFQAPCLGLFTMFKKLKSNRQYLTIDEVELQCASAGYDTWSTYITTQNTDTYKLINEDNGIAFGGAFKDMDEIIKDLDDSYKSIIAKINAGQSIQDAVKSASRDFIAKVPKIGMNSDNIFQMGLLNEDYQNLYSFVNNYASEYYGRQFQVRLPFSCGRKDIENQQNYWSEIPTNEGYTEQPYVLGLPNPGVFTDFFKTENQKLKSFVRFNNLPSGNTTGVQYSSTNQETKYVFVGTNGNIPAHDELQVVDSPMVPYGSLSGDVLTKLDIRGISPEKYILLNGYLYLEAQTKEEIVFSNWVTLSNPRAIIDIGTPIRLWPSNNLPQYMNLLPKLIEMTATGNNPAEITLLIKQRLSGLDQSLSTLNNKALYGPLQYPFVTPEAISIGIRSNMMNYGPWGVQGLPGQTNIVHEESLVPWEYNGSVNMNLAGKALASQSRVNAQINEMGTITFPGYPNVPLGAELGTALTDISSSVIENRSVATNTFNVSGNAATYNYYTINNNVSWSGVNGPCVNNISVEIGTQGVKTTYQLRTYTPKFGRFAKYNADRLKKIGAQSYKVEKFIRTWSAIRNRNELLNG